MTTKAQRLASRCKQCGDGKTNHTIEPECWGVNCLRLPIADRCTSFVAGAPPVEKQVTKVGSRHPMTAVMAASHALPRSGSKRRQVYDWILRKAGCTDDELEYLTGWSHQSVSAARNTLMEDGLIADSGQKRRTRYGNDAIVWVAATV